MREVDGPSFIFTDVNFPALAPRLNLIEIALQLSENITHFAISTDRLLIQPLPRK
jgi:hypothetical protein